MNLKTTGTVYWITGLAGAGKTSVGQGLWERLRVQSRAVVFLDGDALRAVWGVEGGYSREERLRLAMSYSRLCKLISEQGTDVVIATISLFSEVHEWNRQNFPNYQEIYLRVQESVLRSRDHRDLYGRDDVVGTGIAFDIPANADLIVDNDGGRTVSEVVQSICDRLL